MQSVGEEQPSGSSVPPESEFTCSVVLLNASQDMKTCFKAEAEQIVSLVMSLRHLYLTFQANIITVNRILFVMHTAVNKRVHSRA